MKQKLFLVLVMALVGVLFFSCKDEEPSAEVVFKATLNGASERPDPTSSTATGTATLTFNKETKIFTIVVTYSGMTATNGHIHKAAIEESGPPVFPFSTFTSPINYTSTALTAEQESDLFEELYYVNLHSTEFPNGEIRGQLLPE